MILTDFDTHRKCNNISYYKINANNLQRAILNQLGIVFEYPCMIIRFVKPSVFSRSSLYNSSQVNLHKTVSEHVSYNMACGLQKYNRKSKCQTSH